MKVTRARTGRPFIHGFRGVMYRGCGSDWGHDGKQCKQDEQEQGDSSGRDAARHCVVADLERESSSGEEWNRCLG